KTADISYILCEIKIETARDKIFCWKIFTSHVSKFPMIVGETVTLRCDINAEGVTSWQYSWYKEDSTGVFSELQEHTFSPVTESDAGKYFCYGAKTDRSRRSHISDEVTLTVSGEFDHHFTYTHKFNMVLMSDFSISDKAQCRHRAETHDCMRA
uniref:Ig-like domain-containing protein n=1 Tax=Sinocyclocheilus rhinocerous TaxID=307959 RepID=A0A673KEP1_9TELE